ncbi:MAG: transporter substrate-binding domain-containing protein [Candidatus Sulfomarinibacteraceae bacterium]
MRVGLAVCLASLAATATATDPEELRLGSDEWPPFTGSHGKQRAALELIHTALDRAGYQATTTIDEWRRVEAAIRRGDLDGSAAMWRTEAREKTLLFSAPYLENRLVLIGRRGSDVSATRMTDLAGKRVAAVGQYAYGEDVTQAAGVLFVKAKNDQDSLDKLLAGEVEYMLVDELVVQHLLTFQPDEVAANLEIGFTPLARRPLHFAIRRDIPNAEKIVQAVDNEIVKMQGDGSYSEILQIGWIRVDVDGDGLYELVPFGDQVGETPPRSVYDVFGDMPDDDEPPEKKRILVGGDIYQGWDAIPDRYKQPPSQGGPTSFKYGNTFTTLRF